VPFHEPGGLLRPSLARGGWDEGSIEDFWQSNKVLQVRESVPEAALREHLLRPLERHDGAVAVLGGSFNPIHHGHLRLAHDLLEQYGFGRVVFVPNGNGYRKRGLIGEKHRAKMVELALAGEPRFELCDFELNRARVTSTQETLAHLRQRFGGPALYNVRGSDGVVKMLGWNSLPELLEVTQVVAERPGHEAWATFGQDPRFRLYCDHFRLLRRQAGDGSSSGEVRARCAAGEGVRSLVPGAVADYIESEGLYRTP
jgi:nicotinate-nucleotide adenylyltransferase